MHILGCQTACVIKVIVQLKRARYGHIKWFFSDWFDSLVNSLLQLFFCCFHDRVIFVFFSCLFSKGDFHHERENRHRKHRRYSAGNRTLSHIAVTHGEWVSISETRGVNLDLADYRNYSHVSLSILRMIHDLLCSISVLEMQTEKLLKPLD